MKRMAKPSPISSSVTAWSGQDNCGLRRHQIPLTSILSHPRLSIFPTGLVPPFGKGGSGGISRWIRSDKSPSIPLFQRGKSESLLSPGENRQPHPGGEEIRRRICADEHSVIRRAESGGRRRRSAGPGPVGLRGSIVYRSPHDGHRGHRRRPLPRRAAGGAAAGARRRDGEEHAPCTPPRRACASERADLLDANRGRRRRRAERDGLSPALLDRLTLTDGAHRGDGAGLDEIAALPDPVGETIARWRRPNGLEIGQVRIPLGVVGIIYESRPERHRRRRRRCA